MAVAGNMMRLVPERPNDFISHEEMATENGNFYSLGGRFAIGVDLYDAIEELKAVPALKWTVPPKFPDYVSRKVPADEAERPSTTSNLTDDVFLSESEKRSSTVSSTISSNTGTYSQVASLKSASEGEGEKPTKSSSPNGSLASSSEVFQQNEVFSLSPCSPLDVDVYEQSMEKLESIECEAEVIAEGNASQGQRLSDLDINTVYISKTSEISHEAELVNGTKEMMSYGEEQRTFRGPATTRQIEDDHEKVAFREGVEMKGSCCDEDDSDLIMFSAKPSTAELSSSAGEMSAEELFEEIMESLEPVEDDECADCVVNDVHETNARPSGHAQWTTDGKQFSVDKSSNTAACFEISYEYEDRPQSRKRSAEVRVSMECVTRALDECLKALTVEEETCRTGEKASRGEPSVDYQCQLNGPATQVMTETASDVEDEERLSSNMNTVKKSPMKTANERHSPVGNGTPVNSDKPVEATVLSTTHSNASWKPSVYKKVDISPRLSSIDDSSQTVTSTTDSCAAANEEVVHKDQVGKKEREVVDQADGNNNSAASGGKTTASADDNMIVKRVNETTSSECKVTDVDVGQKQQQQQRIEILSDDLITQEIVLKIVRPKRKKAKSDVCTDLQTVGTKPPFRDLHIHRVMHLADNLDVDDTARRDNGSLAIEDGKVLSKASVLQPTASDFVLEHGECSTVPSSSAQKLTENVEEVAAVSDIHVEVDRHAESYTTERFADSQVHVVKEDTKKVLVVPNCSVADVRGRPKNVGDVVDELSRILTAQHDQQQSSDVRVTCEAVQRKWVSPFLPTDVTVINRTIIGNETAV